MFARGLERNDIADVIASVPRGCYRFGICFHTSDPAHATANIAVVPRVPSDHAVRSDMAIPP